MRSSPLTAWLLERSWPLGWVLTGVSSALALWVLWAGPSVRAPAVAATSEPATPETAAARIVGPQACAECHVDEYEVWQTSAHQADSRGLTRLDRAKEIADNLGIRRIKADARCTTCHFTEQGSASRTRAIAGVSCESCHGPAAGWIDEHADFGPDCSDAADESPEHRLARLARSDDAGMVRPSALHALVARCFDCHAITDPELTRVGGHPSGDDFEVVAWSQGEMRHNFVHPDGSAGNAIAPFERLATMYVLGRGLQLELALRALAAADDPTDGQAARARLDRALAELDAIDARIDHEALTALRELARAVEAGPAAALADDAELLVLALEDLSGVDLTPLADLLPGPDDYRGRPSR